MIKRELCTETSTRHCSTTTNENNNNNNNNNNKENNKENFIIFKEYYIYNYTPLYLKVVHNWLVCY